MSEQKPVGENDEIVPVSFLEYKIAHGNFIQNTGREFKVRHWYDYLQINTDLRWWDKTTYNAVICTPEQARRLRMMAGPHHTAVYWAWRVKQEDTK